MNVKYLLLLFIPAFVISHPPCLAQLSPRESRIIKEFSHDLDNDYRICAIGIGPGAGFACPLYTNSATKDIITTAHG